MTAINWTTTKGKRTGHWKAFEPITMLLFFCTNVCLHLNYNHTITACYRCQSKPCSYNGMWIIWCEDFILLLFVMVWCEKALQQPPLVSQENLWPVGCFHLHQEFTRHSPPHPVSYPVLQRNNSFWWKIAWAVRGAKLQLLRWNCHLG